MKKQLEKIGMNDEIIHEMTLNLLKISNLIIKRGTKYYIKPEQKQDYTELESKLPAYLTTEDAYDIVSSIFEEYGEDSFEALKEYVIQNLYAQTKIKKLKGLIENLPYKLYDVTSQESEIYHNLVAMPRAYLTTFFDIIFYFFPGMLQLDFYLEDNTQLDCVDLSLPSIGFGLWEFERTNQKGVWDYLGNYPIRFTLTWVNFVFLPIRYIAITLGRILGVVLILPWTLPVSLINRGVGMIRSLYYKYKINKAASEIEIIETQMKKYTGDIEKSTHSWEMMLGKMNDPDKKDYSNYQKGMLHLDLGQQEEAIEYLSKVEPSDPNYPHAMAIGGSIALTQNQNQTALGFFSKAGEMADDMAKVASNRIQKDKVQDGNPSHNDNTQQGEEFTSSSKNSSDSYPNRSNFTSCEYTGGELIYR